MRREAVTETSGKTIVVVGAGGNIGSHLVPHLARMPGVSRVTLIDKDRYEEGNLWTQNITPRDVGRRKAMVQARRLGQIEPRLRVEAIASAVERVPLGKLRADVMLACLDSRAARQHVNQFAWRLGVPLIDAGVEATGLLARINVYVPGTEGPCLECAWDDRDYEALEQRYACADFEPSVTATNAPSSLGALAASLQAIECRKILEERWELVARGKQVLIDASHHKHYVTAIRRNPNCRFANHEVWGIETLNHSPGQLTLDQALKLAPEKNGKRPVAIALEGKPFVKRLTCAACGKARTLLRIESSLTERQRTCRECGGRMLAAGFDLVDRLSGDFVSREDLSRSLGSYGFRPGDVFSLGDEEAESHYELA